MVTAIGRVEQRCLLISSWLETNPALCWEYFETLIEPFLHLSLHHMLS